MTTMNANGRLPITFGTPAGNQSFAQSLAIAQAAEAAGFTSVSFGDRPHDPALEGWTLATAVAARTERIRVFHSTLNIPFRFPAVLAKQAATLDLLSNGRLDLCLGAGGEANRPLYDGIGVPFAAAGERMTDLEDAIKIMRGLWANEKFSYKGRIHQVEGANGLPQPVQQPIPIWIGAGQPRSLRITGRLGNGFIQNGGWGRVATIADHNAQIDVAARKAGRNPRSIRRLLSGASFVGTAAEVEAYRSTVAPRPREGTGSREGTGGLVGTLEEIMTTIRTYREEAGVDMFNVRFPAGEQFEQIKRFGAEVIPAAAEL